MYKIFINDRILGINDDWQVCAIRPNAIVYKVIKNSEIKSIVDHFQENQAIQELWLLSERPEDVMKEVISQFALVEAAGGLVRNTKGELLLIFRHEHWDLPKGKHEPGETIPETALREVEEECGINQLTLFDLLTPSYHIYKENGIPLLKKTYWYTMQYAGNAPLVPQEAEGIREARWVPMDQIPIYIPKMFSSITDVVRHLIL
jgi:8-oxo-dGTP pyrophosphatase MutT (NUDIX family)